MALRMSAVQLETAPPHVVAGARDLPPGRSWPDAVQAPAIVDLCMSPGPRYTVMLVVPSLGVVKRYHPFGNGFAAWRFCAAASVGAAKPRLPVPSQLGALPEAFATASAWVMQRSLCGILTPKLVPH